MYDDLLDELPLDDAAKLARADGWWLVLRMPDHRHPEVWERRPIACWTLDTLPGESRKRLLPVLGDGKVHPLRTAEAGRDGTDYLQRGDAFPFCRCSSPTTWTTDPSWCMACAGTIR